MKNNGRKAEITKTIDLVEGFRMLAKHQIEGDFDKFNELEHILNLACIKKFGEGKDVQTIDIPIALIIEKKRDKSLFKKLKIKR